MFSWEDFLSISRQLSNNNDEASYRSSISRAYYASLHLCKQKLVDLDSNFSPSRSGGDSHKQIIDQYKMQSKGILKSIGVQLDTLKGKRVKSDYIPFPEVTKKNSCEAIKLSEIIIGKLGQIEDGSFD